MPKNYFKSYSRCINYLFKLERRGIKYDLTNITVLLNYLDNPHNSYKSIHVAGTNGKGSVCAMLNSYLIEKGFKTGLYTSPHISDFRERILIDGKFIEKKFILDFVNRLKPMIDKIKPSFFEVTTAMAFEYFNQKKVTYAVIETGLGGRLDSTNVLKPVLTIITSIAIDHVEFLGDTLDKIAIEKGGIIKRGIPVIIGNVHFRLLKHFKRIAEAKKSGLTIAGNQLKIKIVNRTEKGITFTISGIPGKFLLPLVGDYQTRNILTFLSALRVLKDNENINYNASDIRNAFREVIVNSNFHGRFEKIRNRPKVVVDVSHNLQAIKNIRKNLNYFRYRKLTIIFGIMHDKNFEACLRELGKLSAEVILTRPEYKRSAKPSQLLKSVAGRKKMFLKIDRVVDAVDYAFSKSKRNDLILVTGSFFLAGDFLKAIMKYEM